MGIVKRNTVQVGLEGYLYLQERNRIERIGTGLTEHHKQLLIKNFNKFACRGYIQLMDGDLGGAENGRWTTWSAEQMAKMLDENGFDYKDGCLSECIDV